MHVLKSFMGRSIPRTIGPASHRPGSARSRSVPLVARQVVMVAGIHSDAAICAMDGENTGGVRAAGSAQTIEARSTKRIKTDQNQWNTF